MNARICLDLGSSTHWGANTGAKTTVVSPPNPYHTNTQVSTMAQVKFCTCISISGIKSFLTGHISRQLSLDAPIYFTRIPNTLIQRFKSFFRIY